MFEANFCKFDHLIIFPEVTRGPTKNLDPIGSAVLTFIGYKQTDKQTDKPNLYIDEIWNKKGRLFFFQGWRAQQPMEPETSLEVSDFALIIYPALYGPLLQHLVQN